MTSGSYLEQIHIFVADVRVSSRLLSDLGKLCSPFPAILFTISRRYELPIFKADGSILEFRKLDSQTAMFTKLDMADVGHPGKTPLSVVSCAMTPDMHNIATDFNPQEGSRNGGAGKAQNNLSNPGQGEKAGRNGEEFPGTARLTFDMSSDIYSADNAQDPFHISVTGDLMIEVSFIPVIPLKDLVNMPIHRRHQRF